LQEQQKQQQRILWPAAAVKIVKIAKIERTKWNRDRDIGSRSTFAFARWGSWM